MALHMTGQTLRCMCEWQVADIKKDVSGIQDLCAKMKLTGASQLTNCQLIGITAYCSRSKQYVSSLAT